MFVSLLTVATAASALPVCGLPPSTLPAHVRASSERASPMVSAGIRLVAEAGLEKPIRRPYRTDRKDGRFSSTLGFSHHYIKSVRPRLAFRMEMSAKDFRCWQEQVRRQLRRLMAFPDVLPQPKPQRIWSKPRPKGIDWRNGEVFPEPGSVVPVLGADSRARSCVEYPVPAVLCFPGSSGTKEYPRGRRASPHPSLKPAAHADKNRMALEYVRAGMVAVAVDHPTSGELILREGEDLVRGADRDKLSRDLFYVGRSFLGLSSFQKMCVLAWVKTLPMVDAQRIALSGHSLGTEPAMVLAVLDQDVAAVVLNDFVHGKRGTAVDLLRKCA